MIGFIKNIILSVLFLFSGIFCFSQQTNPSSLYMYNKYNHIPAYAGLEGSLFITGNYRSQWRSLSSGPISQNVNAHMPVYFLKGAAGINIVNQSQGAQRITVVDISYNYVSQFSWGLLSAGINTGIFQYRLDGSKLITPFGIYTDVNFNHNDPRLSESIDNSIAGIYGLSVYLITDYIEGGISLNQFPSYKSALNEGSFRKSSLVKAFVEVPIIIEKYKLTPNLLIQSDFVQTQLDVAVCVENSGNVFGGLGLRGYSNRSLDAVLLILGWKFDKKYSMSYSFDLGISKLRSVHQGTHEIQLNYNFNKKIGAGLSPKVIYNPRFM